MYSYLEESPVPNQFERNDCLFVGGLELVRAHARLAHCILAKVFGSCRLDKEKKGDSGVS